MNMTKFLNNFHGPSGLQVLVLIVSDVCGKGSDHFSWLKLQEISLLSLNFFPLFYVFYLWLHDNFVVNIVLLLGRNCLWLISLTNKYDYEMTMVIQTRPNNNMAQIVVVSNLV